MVELLASWGSWQSALSTVTTSDISVSFDNHITGQVQVIL